MKYINNIATLIGTAILVASCQDPEYPAAVPSTTIRTASIVFINSAPDAPSPVSFFVNNVEAASVAFPEASTAVTINPGAQQFRVKNGVFGIVKPDTISQKADLVSLTSASAVQGNGHYTLILTDTVKRPFGKTVSTPFTKDPGGLNFVLITDNMNAPASGNAGIRFVNMSPGASGVYLTAGGNSLPGSLSTQSHLPKATSVTVSGTKYDFASFASVTAGSYDLEVRTGSASGTIIATLPATEFADGKLYTIFLSGMAVKVGSSTIVKVPYALKVVQYN